MLPLIKINQYGRIIFRKAMLASIMIWVIIFNHKAESSTFIIAVAGAAIWWFSIKPSKVLLALVVLLFIFTCLSPTDLFPRVIRKEWVEPYVLKVVPCIVLWFVIIAQMMGNKLTERNA
jgi:dolichol kinase